jgi:hypothetical protein
MEQDTQCHRAISEIIRGIKGKAPRKSSMRIYMERDGTLNAWKGDAKMFVGYLDIASDFELVKKAIERILSIGILRK